jgi:hypothetical protein
VDFTSKLHTGFDADGSVTLTVNKSKTESSIMSGNHGNTFAYRKVYCQLSLHIVSKDANVLYEVQNALGFGKY